MVDEPPWNEESRAELRETLGRVIRGELRLANDEPESILERCLEVYIVDDCPEEEQEAFLRFAADELVHAAALRDAEMATWPEETDCDRLDRVEAALRGRGILLWQVSPCCDTCTVGALSERVVEIDERHPGFADRVRGYAFFIDQNMSESLAESTEISVYLGYGGILPDGTEITPEEYAETALGVAREVCACLREEGFEVDWNGDLDRKLGLSLNWQRRTILE